MGYGTLMAAATPCRGLHRPPHGAILPFPIRRGKAIGCREGGGWEVTVGGALATPHASARPRSGEAVPPHRRPEDHARDLPGAERRQRLNRRVASQMGAETGDCDPAAGERASWGYFAVQRLVWIAKSQTSICAKMGHRATQILVAWRHQMPSAMAFLPWVAIDTPLTFGPLRLLPYRRKKLPGSLLHAAQSDIDVVLSAYADRPKSQVNEATILEFGEWQTGMDADEMLPALFCARDMLAFAALSNRRLFGGHSKYCNFDTYSLVVQGYTPGKVGSFAFFTRRRDGGTNRYWSSNAFAFHCPYHVDARARISVDGTLLVALLALSEADSFLLEAVTEFNCANTDSSDVPSHVEVVMMKSAFEWLMGIREQVGEFVDQLRERLSSIPSVESLDGPLRANWERARPGAARPLEAWAREFCDLRGASAHGRPRAAPRFVWTARAHLAFASLLFPLLFKKIIADKGRIQLDAYDTERLRRIDAYLLHDPFALDWSAEDGKHPWKEIDSLAFVHARAPLFYPKAGP